MAGRAAGAVRVLHLVKTAVGGHWAYRQMRELRKLGVDVHVAMPDGPLTPLYSAAGVNVHVADFDFQVQRPWRQRQLSAQLIALVDRIRPQLIHSHFVGTTLTMRFALGRHGSVPRLFQVPGPLHLEHRLFRTMEVASAGAADFWIGSCQWTCDAYRRAGIAGERIFLSYYGVDLDGPQAQVGRGTRHRLRSGQSDRSKVAGLVAYMYAPKWYLAQTRGIKGHEDFIDALEICRREEPELIGLFVGGAWGTATRYQSRVVRRGLRSDAVRNRFLGTRNDVRDLYSTLDVAVCPSHSENVGAAVEALLCGVPTVATRVGGLPDVVRHGETGWLVPPRDPRALADAILDAVGNPDKAADLARRGQALAREMFDVRKTAAEISCMYRQILSGAILPRPAAHGSTSV